jgi:hypothetical protein
VDPKFFYDVCDLTKKSDIYSLALVFWELTSCRTPFDYEAGKTDFGIMIEILDGKREKPIPNTNDKFVTLYQSKYKIITKQCFFGILLILLINLNRMLEMRTRRKTRHLRSDFRSQ